MIEDYYNKKEDNKKKSNNFITKVLLSIIMCFCSLIYIKKDDKNLELYKNKVFAKTFSFSKANNILSKYLDKELLKPEKNESTIMVFNEHEETIKENYNNGIKIKYTQNNPIKLIESGIVVYIGEKENLGNTIIIQGVDGYDIWYSNLNNTNVKIYDYIEKNTILGNTKEVIITISKDGKYIDYEEYTKEI